MVEHRTDDLEVVSSNPTGDNFWWHFFFCVTLDLSDNLTEMHLKGLSWKTQFILTSVMPLKPTKLSVVDFFHFVVILHGKMFFLPFNLCNRDDNFTYKPFVFHETRWGSPIKWFCTSFTVLYHDYFEKKKDTQCIIHWHYRFACHVCFQHVWMSQATVRSISRIYRELNQGVITAERIGPSRLAANVFAIYVHQVNQFAVKALT